MGYRWVVGDLLTGRISKTLDVLGTWSTIFDAADSLTASFPIYAFRPEYRRQGYGEGGYGTGTYGVGKLATLQRLEWPEALAATAPAKSFLAVAWVDRHGAEHWIAGGPIWTQDMDEATGTVTLGAAGMESYFNHRYVLPVLEGRFPEAVTSAWKGLPLAMIAKRLVQQARAWTNGNLPIVLPDDSELTGRQAERDYPGHQLGQVGQRLRQLSEVIDGPEFQFVPRRSADRRYMEWFMRIANDSTGGLLTQAGDPWEVDLSVPRTLVANINRKVDGTVIATDIYAAGEGLGEGRPVRYATSAALLAAGYPRLEGEKTSTDSVKLPATLEAHARGELARRGWPAEVLALTVDAASWWRRSPGSRAGDWLTVWSKGRTILPDGDNDLRILSVSANDNALLELACVPTREVA